MIKRTIDAFERWSLDKNGQSIRIDSEMMGLTLDIVTRALGLCTDYFAFTGEPVGHLLAKPLPRSAYLPFGYGPRMCIGSQLRRGRLPAKLVFEPSITAKPKGEVRARLVPLAARALH